MIWIKNKRFPAKGFNAITISPFVFYKRDSDRMRNHERIHGAQQLEVFVVSAMIINILSLVSGFSWWYLLLTQIYYLLYGLNYLIRLITHKEEAYYNISFEREAYFNEYNKQYLTSRKLFAWIKHIK